MAGEPSPGALESPPLEKFLPTPLVTVARIESAINCHHFPIVRYENSTYTVPIVVIIHIAYTRVMIQWAVGSGILNIVGRRIEYTARVREWYRIAILYGPNCRFNNVKDHRYNRENP